MQIAKADRPRDEVKLTQEEVTQAISDYVFKHTKRRVAAGTVQITQMTGNGFNTTAKLLHEDEEVLDNKLKEAKSILMPYASKTETYTPYLTDTSVVDNV